MKRHIRQNIWGNWNGYEGERKVIEFGTSEFNAKQWLETGEKSYVSGILHLQGMPIKL